VYVPSLPARVTPPLSFTMVRCLPRSRLFPYTTLFRSLAAWSAPIQARRHSTRVHNPAVEKRLAAITAQDSQRANVYEVRAEAQRSEEHTSELQSRFDLVCRLLLEKKKKYR